MNEPDPHNIFSSFSGSIDAGNIILCSIPRIFNCHEMKYYNHKKQITEKIKINIVQYQNT